MNSTTKNTNLWTLRSVFGFIPLSMRQSILYALALLFSKGIGFLMIPVFTHFLEPADYGRLDILQTLADLLSIILIMGLSDALFKYYGEAKTQHEKDRVLGNVFGMALVLCIVSTFLLQLAAPLIASLLPGDISLWQTRFILISLSVSACLLIPLCWYRMQDQAFCYFKAASGRVLMQALLSIALLYYGFGVTGVMAAGAIASLFWTIKTSWDFLSHHRARFDLSYWKKFSYYGMPLILTGMAGFVLGGFDRWILADSAGPDIMAKYALAAKFGLLTVLLIQPFDLWWTPKRFEILNSKNGAQKCADTITVGITIVCLSTITIASFAPLAITIMTPETYHDAIQYVPYLCGLAGLHALTQLTNIGIFNVKVTKWPAVVDISAAIIAFTGYMILIPIWQAWGAIAATAIALSLRFAVTFFLSQSITALPYQYGKIIVLGMLTLFSVLILSEGFSLTWHLVIGCVCLSIVSLSAFSMNLIPIKSIQNSP